MRKHRVWPPDPTSGRFGPAVLAGSLVGCLAGGHARPSEVVAGEASSSPAVLFPAAGELERLPRLPAPAQAFTTDAIAVDEWGALAPPSRGDDEAKYRDESPWGDYARSLAGATVRLSPALRCAATELARFQIDKGAMPTEGLRRFMVARCGGSSPKTTALVVTLSAPAAFSDAAVYERTKPPIHKLVETAISIPRRQAVGLATIRTESRFAAVAVVGTDEVALTDEPRVADTSRRVLVRGRMRTAFPGAFAYVNRGEYAVSRCESDPRIALPQFAFSCSLDKGDRAAWVQVLARRDGSVLVESVADLLVEDGSGAPLEYRARVLGPAAPVRDAGALSSILLDAINRVRHQGKLAPLALEPAQSAVNTQLAGTLIDASTKGRESEANQIALGLLAGWNVGGVIRAGHLFVGLVAPTRDANAWLSYALVQPLGRLALLDPDVGRIAIGAALPGGVANALGAVVATYSLFESTNHDTDVSRVLARVASARAAAGMAPVVQMDADRELGHEAQEVLGGTREPTAALRLAVNRVAQKTGGTVSGYLAETSDIDTVPIPEPVIQSPHCGLAVQVTHRRVKGAAWGQYVIFYLLAPVGEQGGTPSVRM